MMAEEGVQGRCPIRLTVQLTVPIGASSDS